MFKKILIANRGEIALRIMRSAQEMGIKTVAVFSEADRKSLPVKIADEAFYIGKSPASESYLDVDKIIEIAKMAGAEAIHPGYGFLSENVGFARRCKQESIEFIGPPEKAIEEMGDKITARKTMIEAGVQVVPGVEGVGMNENELFEEAKKIGFPVMVKASAGGGGKGMRLVEKAEDFLDSLNMAKSEAQSAFGNSTVYIEKYIANPHHIEFQVLADKFGNTVHINERECSIQRRHQKIVEETPSTIMTDEVRKKMGEEAVKAAKAVNYTGAGTIEFLVDDQLNYYFLEMNTRLQVEHPITEMTSGFDLVKEQIKIADNQKLEYTQSEIRQYGHSIECRIYAEDTQNNFMPSPGKIIYLKQPYGNGIRIDGYAYTGFHIPIDYDPMIGKLIVWGQNRTEAIERMKRALLEFRILGLKHNIPYLYKVFTNDDFLNGNYNTNFVAQHYDELQIDETHDEEKLDAAAIAVYMDYTSRAESNTTLEDLSTNTVWKNSGLPKY